MLSFKGNPFAEFVELPAACAGLNYSNIICGAVTGALKMVQVWGILPIEMLSFTFLAYPQVFVSLM